MATFTVTAVTDQVFEGGSLADASADGLSLREALGFANANGVPNTILFDESLAGEMLVLTEGALLITSDLVIDGDIDGDGDGDVTVSGGDASRIFNILVGTVTIDALTMRDGNAAGDTGDGGAILIEAGGQVEISNSTVTDNSAGRNGGAIAVRDGDGQPENSSVLTLSNSTVADNIAAGGGGGVFVGNGAIGTITDSSVASNDAELAGGGVFIAGGMLTVADSTVGGNVVDAGTGGGIAQEGGTLVLSNGVISGNTAITQGGGGVSSAGEDASLSVANTTVSGNRAAGDGGGILMDGGDAEIVKSTISSNQSYQSGGGLKVSGGGLTVLSSTVSGNQASLGGGGISHRSDEVLVITNGTVSGNTTLNGNGGGLDAGQATTITSSTFSGNLAASGTGGGIYSQDYFTTLTNTIVAGNADAAGAASPGADFTANGDDVPADIFGGLNILGTLSQGLSQSADPAVLGLGAGNGYTLNDVFEVVGPDASSGVAAAGVLTGQGGPVDTIALARFGIAVDAGVALDLPLDTNDIDDDANTTEPLPLDARGLTRVDGADLDVGAFEVQADNSGQTFIVTTTEDQAFVGGSLEEASADGLSLREAIGFASEDELADIILFDEALGGETITLSGTDLAINTRLSISGDVDGDFGPDITIDGDGASRIFSIGQNDLGFSVEVTLVNLALVNGSAASGGGMEIAGGTDVTLRNIQVSASEATDGDGGAIQNTGFLRIEGGTLSGNSASGSGGGLQNNGIAILSNVAFTENTAAIAGGGLSNVAALSGYGLLVDDNQAVLGGGIYNANPGANPFFGMLLTSSSVSGNTADSSGGGIANTDGASLTIYRASVSDNQALGVQILGGEPSGYGGGLFNDQDSTLIVTNTTFASNSANQSGGGLQNNGTAQATQITLSGNYADNAEGLAAPAGGLSSANGSTTLSNSIIAGNGAQGVDGPGAEIAGDGDAVTLLLEGTNLLGATPEGFQVDLDTVDDIIFGIGNSFDLSDVFAAVIPIADTGIEGGELADNGAFVQTIALTDGFGNPAIGSGDADRLSELITGINFNGDGDLTGTVVSDARGQPRGENPDLGAFEIDEAAITPGTLSIAVVDGDLNEGDAETVPFTFEISRTGGSDGSVSVDLVVSGAGEDGAEADDFDGGVFLADTVTFADGETSQIVTVRVAGDEILEADEGFVVTLSNPTGGAELGAATANGTIRNDDQAGTLNIEAIAGDQDEGNDGLTGFTYRISRTGGTEGAVTVDVTVSGTGGNPADADDFENGILPAQTVILENGEAETIFTVQVSGDADVEGDETFSVTLSNPVGSIDLGAEEATGTIRDDDTAGLLTLEAIAAEEAEGNTGTTNFTFRVSRSGALDASVGVDFVVTGSGDIAAVASDFAGAILPTGSVVLDEGEAETVITVEVAGDRVEEGDEAFTVTLVNPTGGVELGTTVSATGLIINDDEPGTLSIEPVSNDGLEGNSGTTDFTFRINRTGGDLGMVTADFTVAGSGENPAEADDFSGGTFPSGTITLDDGETETLISIPVNGDAVSELDETFTVTLSSPGGGADLGTDTASGTIRNDELPGVLSVELVDGDRPEGDEGPSPFSFRVVRTEGSQGTVSADFVVSGSGATPADADDFAGGLFPTGTVTLEDGQTESVITFDVNGDQDLEVDEDYTITLANPGGGADLGTASVSGVIRDDDADDGIPGVLSIDLISAEIDEGDRGTTEVTFRISRADGNAGVVTVDFAVSGSGDDPVSADDFEGGILPAGTVVLEDGEADATFSFAVQGDSDVEADEEFTVTLANPTGGASIDSGSVTGIISNDDTDPDGGDGGSTGQPTANADAFTVRRDQILTGNVLDDQGGGADLDPQGEGLTVSEDLGPANGILDLNADGSFTYEPNADFVGQDRFIYRVADGDGDTATALVTITVEGVGTFYEVESVIAPSGDFEGTLVNSRRQITVTRNGDLSVPGSVELTVSGTGDNPTTDSDFIGDVTSRLVEFAPGQSRKVFALDVFGDSGEEQDETYLVSLANPVNGTLPASVGEPVLATIIDDDGIAEIRIDGPEGSPPETVGRVIDASFVFGPVQGTDGDDLVVGGERRDQLSAGPGADQMAGGAGNDFMAGEEGDDLISGGAGNDRLFGDEGDDFLFGDHGNDRIFGGIGNDSIDGGEGRDKARAGNGDDTIEGGAGKDRLFGEGGNDGIKGGAGKDRLEGGTGQDTLSGGADRDKLRGGSDADTFIYLPGDGRDTIRDFEPGVDKIDLTGIPSIESFDDLVALLVSPSGRVRFDFGAGDILDIRGLKVEDLNEADFIL